MSDDKTKKSNITESTKNTTVHYRTNYWKYESTKNDLKKILDSDLQDKEMAKMLNISVPTFYKYKCMLSVENNIIYKSQEEKKYLENKKSIPPLKASNPIVSG